MTVVLGGSPVNYAKAALSGVAGVVAALLGPGLLYALWATSQQKATGIGAVILWESLVSPRFWILAILLSCLFFAASRLSSKALRVILFWTPTLMVLTLGFGYVALLTHLWIHFRNSVSH
jgi:hypothetical protein